MSDKMSQDSFESPEILNKYEIQVTSEDDTRELQHILKKASKVIEGIGIYSTLNLVFLEAIVADNEEIVGVLARDKRIERLDSIVTLACRKKSVEISLILQSAGGFRFKPAHLEECFRMRNLKQLSFLLAVGINPTPEMLRQVCLMQNSEERDELMIKLVEHSSLIPDFNYTISALACLKCYLTLQSYLNTLQLSSITLSLQCKELMVLECLEHLMPHILEILTGHHAFPITYQVLVKASDPRTLELTGEEKRWARCLRIISSKTSDINIILKCIDQGRTEDAEKLILLNKVWNQQDKNTLLLKAVEMDCSPLVDLLLKHGAIPSDNRALLIACQKSYKRCFRTLLVNKCYDKYIGSVHCTEQDEIIAACIKNPNSYIIKGFLKRPIFQLPYYSIFLSACCKRRNKVVMLLISKTDIRQQRVGLLNAIEVGSLPCVDIILRYSNWEVVNYSVKLYAQDMQANFMITNLINLGGRHK
jgi:hypothetical protein